MSSPVVESRERRYVLIERLGRGGAAETWRARREGDWLDQELCIKRPLRSLNTEQRRAVLEEARVLARIRHANVVSLIDVAFDDENPCLVLELIRGLDLRLLSSALSDGRELLPPGVVAAIGAQLCRALAAAQRSVPGGLVHRDVTPHNVLISTEGEVKLTDFGVARAFDRERWTAPGLIKGKRAYVSPEQVRGEELDVRSDLFAVGVVLFELLTGKRPFGREGGGGALQAIAAGERSPLELRAADARLVATVEQLLAHERSDRPPSADRAAHLLGAHADEQRAAEILRARVLVARRPGLARSARRDCKPLNGWLVVGDPTMCDKVGSESALRVRSSAARHGR